MAKAEFEAGYHQLLSEVQSAQTWDLNGLRIASPAGVYPPHPGSSTRLFINSFTSLDLDRPRPGQRLLEVGCGSGAVALWAARLGWSVSAGDLLPACVEAARRNALANGLAIDVRRSDLMAGFAGETFDLIAFNQPFFHPDQALADECALADPRGALHARFMHEARRFLRPGGRVVFGFANCSNAAVLEQPGWTVTLRALQYEGDLNYIRAWFSATPC